MVFEHRVDIVASGAQQIDLAASGSIQSPVVLNDFVVDLGILEPVTKTRRHEFQRRSVSLGEPSVPNDRVRHDLALDLRKPGPVAPQRGEESPSLVLVGADAGQAFKGADMVTLFDDRGAEPSDAVSRAQFIFLRVEPEFVEPSEPSMDPAQFGRWNLLLVVEFGPQ